MRLCFLTVLPFFFSTGFSFCMKEFFCSTLKLREIKMKVPGKMRHSVFIRLNLHSGLLVIHVFNFFETVFSVKRWKGCLK